MRNIMETRNAAEFQAYFQTDGQAGLFVWAVVALWLHCHGIGGNAGMRAWRGYRNGGMPEMRTWRECGKCGNGGKAEMRQQHKWNEQGDRKNAISMRQAK